MLIVYLFNLLVYLLVTEQPTLCYNPQERRSQLHRYLSLKSWFDPRQVEEIYLFSKYPDCLEAHLASYSMVQRLRMTGGVSPLAGIISWCAQGHLYVFMYKKV
jgi:hypothetical protein